MEGKIILYSEENSSVYVNVYFDNDTFWMTQKALAELFDCSTDHISLHLKNIFADEELEEKATTGEISLVQLEGARQVKRKAKYYSLDAIIAVGYRVNSKKATKFRQWATKTLKEYIQKGFLLNDDMLKNIDLDDIIIRDFQKTDAENLHRIVREKEIFRFMKDWAENAPEPKDLYSFIEWIKRKKDSTDVYENKRYAISLKRTGELIGMVGMGLEDTINEVEVAYFMSEKYQRKGYTVKAVNALVSWCFQVSEIPYLILTIDCANTPSCKLAEKCGFELFERRTPIGHTQPNMESDSYYYYRKYRK